MNRALDYLAREVEKERISLEGTEDGTVAHAAAMDMIRFFEARLEIAQQMPVVDPQDPATLNMVVEALVGDGWFPLSVRYGAAERVLEALAK